MNSKVCHDGDCSIYRALLNQNPWDGICTCGKGWEFARESGGDYSQMLSEERLEKANAQGPVREVIAHVVVMKGYGVAIAADQRRHELEERCEDYNKQQYCSNDPEEIEGTSSAYLAHDRIRTVVTVEFAVPDSVFKRPSVLKVPGRVIYNDPVWKYYPMPEDYTCQCGNYVHPTRRNLKAFHTPDCPYNLQNAEVNDGCNTSAKPTCSVCGGTGQDNPPPGKCHGLCKSCGGSGQKLKGAINE